jgi:very-short-patch-repair endonuclease
MSNLSDKVKLVIKEIFPYYRLEEEFFVNYMNQKLYFDFYLHELNLLIEVQGGQHYKFTEHFHGDRQGYIESKKRDNLKQDYAFENGITLLTLDEKTINKLDGQGLLREIEKGKHE